VSIRCIIEKAVWDDRTGASVEIVAPPGHSSIRSFPWSRNVPRTGAVARPSIIRREPSRFPTPLYGPSITMKCTGQVPVGSTPVTNTRSPRGCVFLPCFNPHDKSPLSMSSPICGAGRVFCTSSRSIRCRLYSIVKHCIGQVADYSDKPFAHYNPISWSCRSSSLIVYFENSPAIPRMGQ